MNTQTCSSQGDTAALHSESDDRALQPRPCVLSETLHWPGGGGQWACPETPELIAQSRRGTPAWCRSAANSDPPWVRGRRWMDSYRLLCWKNLSYCSKANWANSCLRGLQGIVKVLNQHDHLSGQRWAMGGPRATGGPPQLMKLAIILNYLKKQVHDESLTWEH